MNLISERSINRTLKKVDGRGKKVEYPYKFDDNLIVTGPWNMKSFMILDIIADLVSKKFWGKYDLEIPKNPYDINVLKYAKTITKETVENINPNISIIITDKEIFMDYLFLLEYSSKQLYNLFKNTSDCSFKIKYPIRIYDLETKKYGTCIFDNFDNGFENLFDIEVINEKKSGTKTYGLEYKITFNSYLSKLFIHNVLTINFDWIDSEIYSLENISELLYRKYKLINKNRKQYVIYYDDFTNILGLNINNITVVKKNIEKGLKGLQEINDIESWRLGIKSRRDLTYYEVNNKFLKNKE